MRFQRSPINSSRDIDDSLKEAEDEFYMHLLDRGVVVPGIHLAFISAAHTPEDIDQVIDAFKESFREVRKKGLL
jgi:glutamate-1-semialdehyde aminotransferase